MPLLAVTASGVRLGQGKGFYDRALAGLLTQCAHEVGRGGLHHVRTGNVEEHHFEGAFVHGEKFAQPLAVTHHYLRVDVIGHHPRVVLRG